jgi:hypothetical protein
VPDASAGAFPTSQPVDRSAFGLSIQRDQLATKATGSALGMGQRVAPDPTVLFSHPPMSGAQFGGGSNPKATFTQTPSPQE